MSLSHSSTTCLDSGRGGIIYIALGQAILQWKAERCVQLKGSEPPVARAHGMGEAGATKGVQLIGHTFTFQMLSVTLKPLLRNSGIKGRCNNVHALRCKSVPALAVVPCAALQSLSSRVGWKYLPEVVLYH